MAANTLTAANPIKYTDWVLFTYANMTNQIYPSHGRWTTASTFVPLFPETPKQFKVTTDEDYKAKAQESTSGTGNEAQSGITPQNEQTTTQETEQAQP